MNIKEVISKFGGQTALANLVGVNQSAVAYWVKRGSFPSKWHAPLLDLANKHAIPLEADDLIIGHDKSARDQDLASNIKESQPLPKTGIAMPPVELLSAKVPNTSNFMFYASGDVAIKVQVIVAQDTVWASQKGMAEIFEVDVRTISEHLKNIFNSSELVESAVIRNFRITAVDNKNYDTNFYSLDAVISVGYRVNSYQATQFRKWATSVLREYLIKGFALDDERLKQGKQLFGKDYFDELLERIREIRASERRFYQKITDIYSDCSIDYDKNAALTQTFYAQVQDKLHYAIHGHTSAELIKLRADASKPKMGLTSYKNEKNGGKVLKTDITVGKNYLSEPEIQDLNRLVSMYLDFAEGFVRRQIPMKMQDWIDKLNEFLRFNAYEVLANFGSTSRRVAQDRAIVEFEKFRVVQDKEYKSDFDDVVEQIKTSKKLPKSL